MINAKEARQITQEKRYRMKKRTLETVQQVYSYDLIRIGKGFERLLTFLKTRFGLK